MLHTGAAHSADCHFENPRVRRPTLTWTENITFCSLRDAAGGNSPDQPDPRFSYQTEKYFNWLSLKNVSEYQIQFSYWVQLVLILQYTCTCTSWTGSERLPQSHMQNTRNYRRRQNRKKLYVATSWKSPKYSRENLVLWTELIQSFTETDVTHCVMPHVHMLIRYVHANSWWSMVLSVKPNRKSEPDCIQHSHVCSGNILN